MKIGVVGTGNVGAACAYACVLRGVGTEIVMVDQSHDLAVAQAEDILHATPFAAPIPVRAGDFSDLHGAVIVMIAAGVGQRGSETRLDLLKRNAEVFAATIPQILKAAPQAILLIATNPVDVMTHIAAKFAGENCSHKTHRVIGSGTILDTVRFRTLIATHFGVSSHSVHAHVLGEHGDSEVLHWSGANISNISLAEFSLQSGTGLPIEIQKKIEFEVKNAAYRIIKGKGATWFGIGCAMARIAEVILDDEHAMLTCSTPTARVCGIENVSLSLPRLVSFDGIEKTIMPSLNSEEEKALTRSATIIKEATEAVLA